MTPALRWPDFLAALNTDPEALTQDGLFELMASLSLDCATLAPYLRFGAARYERTPILTTKHLDLMCLCWEPGQGTVIHSHGASFGVVRVFEGLLSVESFRRTDDGLTPGVADLEPLGRTQAPAGTVLLDRPGAIHRLGNRQEGGRRLVTLHAYAGPLDWMEVYAPGDRRVERRPREAEPADLMAAYI